MFEERRLAYARGAADDEHAALPAAGRVEQPVQSPAFSFAAAQHPVACPG